MIDEVTAIPGVRERYAPMTLPHELPRVVLLEQIYRAPTILKGRSYYHG